MHCFRFCFAATFVLTLWLGFCTNSRGQVAVPNASFEEGDTTPTGWTLNQGSGKLLAPGADGERAIAVTGDGKSSNAWTSQPLALESNTVYHLQFQARRVSGTSGSLMTGPLFCNRDITALDKEWTRLDSFFVTPHQTTRDQNCLRFGQWEVAGEVAFDDVRLTRAIPLYSAIDGVSLGSGEAIQNGRYTFNAPYNQASANHARPLVGQQCHFNSNRWVLSSPDTFVVYRHHVGHLQRQATVQAEIGWYRQGELVLEVSREGTTWQELGSLGELGTASFDVPAALLPADDIWVRVSARKKAGETASAALQMYAYRYEASLEGSVPDLAGLTRFLTVTQESPQLEVTVLGIGDAIPGGRNFVELQVRNTSDHSLTLDVAAVVLPVTPADQATPASAATSHPLSLAAGAESSVLLLPYELDAMEPRRLQIAVAGEAAYTAETKIEIQPLHVAHYGETLPDSSDSVGLWWCSSGWKISAQRPVPKQHGAAILIRAAANETEAAQLVVRPESPISDLKLQVSELTGPDGKTIPATAVEIQRVQYVHVALPTDASSTVGLWPDPLPPLEATEQLLANRNFPLWVRVHVPRGQAAGLYQGTISLRGEGLNVSAPLQVEVFGFELPDRMTCKTAFGLDTSLIWRYHRLTSESQRREVLAKYLQCLSDHHIAPYQPAPLDPIHVTWKNLPAWGGGEYDAEQPHTGKYSLKIADDSDRASVNATYLPKIAIPKLGWKFRFQHRSVAAKQPFIVTFQHYDAAGRWMSGRNNDIRIEGTADWQTFQRTIEQFPDGAASVQLVLRATLWNEAGSETGTVWFDDMSLTDLENNKQLIIGGGFESQEQPIPVPEFDFTRWDLAMTQAIDRLHFNTFRLDVPGLGGGTFHARYEPELLGYPEDSPQYQGAMKAYLEQLQVHLREKGWLDEAFVYWFDEPDPKDYEFVSRGFAKLKRWAPDIARMLTEQVEPDLTGGPNIWCPLTPSYDDEIAQARRNAGEDFWWYVCTGPKAPYCTLFIDHPGTEMRVWLWQTWQRDISGILVWQSNYWTSPAAYPNGAEPQNPYLDPMGWVSGYSTAAGTRSAWGNGDGRFIYPPTAAADGHPANSVLDGPVDSIRLEMLRDGIEDYEYLTILKQLLHQHGARLSDQQRAEYQQLLAVPPEITSNLTTFTNDPEPIEARRRAVAQAIEALKE